MSERYPIQRDTIQQALIYLEALQKELQDGLDERKGFVSKFYLEEKLDSFNLQMRCILSDSYTEEVVAP